VAQEEIYDLAEQLYIANLLYFVFAADETDHCRINLGLGPQGLGGDTTALAVLVEAAPCHIASLPVVVNIECHSHRHKTEII